MLNLRIRNISVGDGDSYIVDGNLSGDNPKIKYNLDKIYNELKTLGNIDFNRLQYKEGVLVMSSTDYIEICRAVLCLGAELEEPVEIEVEKYLFEDDLYEIAEKYYGFKNEEINSHES